MRALLRRWLLEEASQPGAKTGVIALLSRGVQTVESAGFFGLAAWLGYQWWTDNYVEPIHFASICGAYVALAMTRLGAKQAAADVERASVPKGQAPTLAAEQRRAV